MKARIVGQNHTVIAFEFNGRKRFIVDKKEVNQYTSLINDVVSEVGRDWAKVTNYIDSRVGKYFTVGGNGYTINTFTPGLRNAIERNTY